MHSLKKIISDTVPITINDDRLVRLIFGKSAWETSWWMKFLWICYPVSSEQHKIPNWQTKVWQINFLTFKSCQAFIIYSIVFAINHSLVLCGHTTFFREVPSRTARPLFFFCVGVVPLPQQKRKKRSGHARKTNHSHCYPSEYNISKIRPYKLVLVWYHLLTEATLFLLYKLHNISTG